MRALKLSGDPMAMANPDGAPSLHDGLLAGFGGFAPGADVQFFVPASCTQQQPAATAGQDNASVWDKPKGCRFVIALVQAPGGGGGSAAKESTTTVACGGGGGGGGGGAVGLFLADDLPDELSLYVQAGFAGGAAQSSNASVGSAGGAPSNTTRHGLGIASATNVGLLLGVAPAGSGGGGTTTTGPGGAAANAQFGGVSGLAASTSGGGGSGNNTATGLLGGQGGASGGGLTSANAHSAGGNCGVNAAYTTTQAGAGGIGGVAGKSATNGLLNYLMQNSDASNKLPLAIPVGLLQIGCSGAGGGSASSGDAVSGGDGGAGLWGSGGGGGGAATNTTSPHSGAGGNGGDGFIIVIAI